LKTFLIYAFLTICVWIDISVNYLRKLIRVFQIANEAKIMEIMKKLDIEAYEATKVYENSKMGIDRGSSKTNGERF